MPQANVVQCPPGEWAQLVKQCEAIEVEVDLAVTRECMTLIDNITLDDDPTFYNSACVDVSDYAYGMLMIDLAVGAGAPTDCLFEVWTGCATGECDYKIMDGPLGDLRYDDTVCPITESIAIPYFCDWLQVRAIGTGTAAGATFVITANVCLVQGV